MNLMPYDEDNTNLYRWLRMKNRKNPVISFKD